MDGSKKKNDWPYGEVVGAIEIQGEGSNEIAVCKNDPRRLAERGSLNKFKEEVKVTRKIIPCSGKHECFDDAKTIPTYAPSVGGTRKSPKNMGCLSAREELGGKRGANDVWERLNEEGERGLTKHFTDKVRNRGRGPRTFEKKGKTKCESPDKSN